MMPLSTWALTTSATRLPGADATAVSITILNENAVEQWCLAKAGRHRTGGAYGVGDGV